MWRSAQSEFDKAIKILLTHYRLLFKYAYDRYDKINIANKFLNTTVFIAWVLSAAMQRLLKTKLQFQINIFRLFIVTYR